jgi:general secretion pathway protein E
VRKPCSHCAGKGCGECGQTGYQGCTGNFEMLQTNDGIRAQIHNKTSEAEIRAAALGSCKYNIRV